MLEWGKDKGGVKLMGMRRVRRASRGKMKQPGSRARDEGNGRE